MSSMLRAYSKVQVSLMLKSILSEYRTPLLKYLERLIQLFDGYNREWQIKHENGKYIKPFFINSAYDIISKAEYKPLNTFELAFSVQKFNDAKTFNFYDWDFIIDIDKCSLTERKQICKQITRLLEEFNITYLIDTRMHIWLPSYTHYLREDWNQLYERKTAQYIKEFIYACTDVKNKCEIDSGLWYVNRHKIRCPYTFHLETKQLQIFYDKDFKPLTFKQVEQIWKGENFSTVEKEQVCLGFNKFIDYALEIGKSLVEGLNINDIPIEEHHSIRNKKLRPCFEHALKNTKDMPHKQRMATVLEALVAGYRDPLEIAKLFSNQSDFKMERSLYQVNDIIKRTKFIKPYRCKTIQRLGWCIKQKCKYYKEIL